MVVRKHMKGTMPWSITTDGPRAAIDVVIAEHCIAIGYLIRFLLT